MTLLPVGKHGEVLIEGCEDGAVREKKWEHKMNDNVIQNDSSIEQRNARGIVSRACLIKII